MTNTGAPATVLYLDNSYSFGGAIISLAHLVGSLESDRYRAHVVSGQPAEYLDSLFPSAPTRTLEQKLLWKDDALYRTLRSLPGLRTGIGRGAVDLGRAAYWTLVHDLPTAVRYASIARSSGAELIHLNNNVESQLSGLLGAKLSNVPCVAHNRSFQRPQRALRWHFKLVDHHIAISTAVRDNLLELGAPEHRVAVVHDAVNVEEIRSEARRSAPREEFGITDDQLVFGLFGRVVPWKGTLEFVRAAVEVLTEEPAARAFVVGDASDGDPEYFDEVRGLAGESGVSDRFEFPGYRDDVPALMDAMDVVVHASTVPEPFGMVLIEAMALEKPVVATRGGGPDDIVVDGETGVLVPPRSPSSLTDSVLRLLRSPETRAAMGRRGAARVDRKFTSQRYARDTMEIYDHLLGRTSSATSDRARMGSLDDRS